MPANATCFIVRGGTVCDQHGRRKSDVFVSDGVIADPATAPPDIGVLDARGCWVLPGLVDLHTHVRQPGACDVEDIDSAARAAAMGGYTCITVMPNTMPPIDRPAIVDSLRHSASNACIEVRIASCMTRNLLGREVVDVEALGKVGTHYFVDETRGIRDTAVLADAIGKTARAHALAGAYCLDDQLAGSGVAHDGAIALELGLQGISPKSEEIPLERYIALAEALDAPLHLLSISTARSAAMIRESKRRGSSVTAEVSPHHLLLSDEDLRPRDPMRKMRPPLRTAHDRAALVNAILDDTLDIIVTDHAPHPQQTKECGFEDASFGVTGLETALAWVAGSIDMAIERLVEKMSIAPARIGQYHDQGGPIEVSRPANVCVFDPGVRWQVDDTRFKSKSKNSPIVGQWLTGRVRHTIASGVAVVVDGMATTKSPDEEGARR
jgi:dihydroorotase